MHAHAAIRVPDLEGKAFLVTGASTGIGAAVARALGRQGARVAVHYRRSEAEAWAVADDVTAAGAEAWLVAGDLGDPRAVEAVVAGAGERFGRLDGLVNNAGALVRRAPIEEVTDELYDEVLDLNVRSVVVACRAAVPWLRRQGGGVIVNTSSVAARNGGGPGSGLYASAKAFVSNLTRGLAKELVGDRIRVNAMAPGVIATPFHERFSTPEQVAGMVAAIPTGRAGTAEDCAGAYLFLCSDLLSGYVTGQVIEVNGGLLMP
jgi:3-oxoacyl-[acyl-carrier protein] reductase